MEKPSASWAEYEHESRDRYVKGRFTTSDCQACYYRPLCPKGKDRQLLLRLEKQDEALRATRALMESEEGMRLYQGRAGIESAIAQAVRRAGLRRVRYRGLEKTRLQHLATAAALSLTRLGARLLGERPAPPRTAPVARLAPEHR